MNSPQCPWCGRYAEIHEVKDCLDVWVNEALTGKKGHYPPSFRYEYHPYSKRFNSSILDLIIEKGYSYRIEHEKAWIWREKKGFATAVLGTGELPLALCRAIVSAMW